MTGVKRVIVTILDGMKETSMPFNEFVLWRANHKKEELEHLVICADEIQEPKPDILLPDNLRIEYLGKNMYGWRRGLKKILGRYEKDGVPYAVHLHQAGPSMKLLFCMLGTQFRKKVVFTVHSSFAFYPLHNKIRSFFDGLLSEYVICCGKTSFDYYPAIIKRIKGGKASYIRNGVDTERIDGVINSEGKVKKDYVLFCYAARMIPLKNHDFLIDVAKEASPKARFLLLGKEDESVIKRIREEGLTGRVEVTGLVPRDVVFRRMRDADVYISTSSLEGLPISVLEGMYLGLPALLSDIPQHREVVGNNNEFSKLLPFNVDAWTKAINEIVEKEPDVLRQLGQASRRYVGEHFSLRAMHEMYDTIYRRLQLSHVKVY